MEILTFKRRGYTDTVEVYGEGFYIEYHHLTGGIKIVRLYDVIKTWNKQQYRESHIETLYQGRTNYKGEKPREAITEIEKLIKIYCGIDVKFNNYVLAYDTRENFYNKIYTYLNYDLQPEEITA